MSNSVDSRPPKASASANIFNVGSDLLSEVHHAVGNARVKALRIRVGDHVIKEIPVAPLTVIATIILVIGAILVSNLKIEVVKDPPTE